MKVATLLEISSPESAVEHRQPHREYLDQLKAKGKLAASGAFEDRSGALLIYEVESLEEAEQLLAADPFTKEGVFVKKLMKVWEQRN